MCQLNLKIEIMTHFTEIWLVTANFNHSMIIRKFAPECMMLESTNIYYKPRVLTLHSSWASTFSSGKLKTASKL